METSLTTTTATTTTSQSTAPSLPGIKDDEMIIGQEMADLLHQCEEASVHKTLVNLETQVSTIREKLEKKTPRVSMVHLDHKLNRILLILKKNGFDE